MFAVILYHAEFYFNKNFLFSGGFLGVDIFFVISGYLITNILYNEFIVTKSISIKNFYEERAKRILPAFFFIIIINSNFYICFTSITQVTLQNQLYHQFFLYLSLPQNN